MKLLLIVFSLYLISLFFRARTVFLTGLFFAFIVYSKELLGIKGGEEFFFGFVLLIMWYIAASLLSTTLTSAAEIKIFNVQQLFIDLLNKKLNVLQNLENVYEITDILEENSYRFVLHLIN